MKVFITGATGYIGFNVATTLRRAGHDVYGLCRSEEKAKKLAKEEIHPVMGDMEHPESYRVVAEKCSILIHAAVDYSEHGSNLDRKTLHTLVDAGETGARPKTFIYTSGCWCAGDTGDGMADETTPPNPIKMVEWRVESEQMVLNASTINGIVIRPACVYGKQGGLTGMWFDGAFNKGNLQVVGDGSNYWTMVHVDDLANAYLSAAESDFKGELFNISDRSRSTVRRMAEAVARVTGFPKDITYTPFEEATKQMGDFAEALAINQHIDSRKAVRMLDWQPQFGGFVDGIETYFESWKAAQG